MAHHCIHPSRVRSGLRMTRTTTVDPLSHSVASRVKPLFVAWTISMDRIVPAVFATGAECVKWSADFGLSVTSRLLDSLMKFLRGCEQSRLQEAHSQTIASVLMRRRSLQLLSRLRRFRSFLDSSRCGLSTPAVACCNRTIIQNFWHINDCFRTESRFGPGRVLWSCCHHINNYCLRFSERQSGVR